jgi:PKD repeat protein
LNNCIAYFNRGANYDSSSVLNYCCTKPQPANGVGNISLEPQLASAWRLSDASPCRGAGAINYVGGTDIDDEAWASPPSLGCDEYHAGALMGALSAGLTASFTNISVGYAPQFTALIQGRAATSVWDFGDGVTATNQPYTSHAWTAPGDYAVVLRAYNGSWPDGISATVTVHVVPGIHYVSASNTNPVAPYTSWATAATRIQVAIDAAIEPGAQVLVTNGFYNPIYIPRAVTVRSVNGPDSTMIFGGRYNRFFGGGSSCAYLAHGASLSGFTLTGGFAESGAGVFCESRTAVVSNCVVSGNQAGGGSDFELVYYRGYGGGAYGGTLNNCTLSDNSVTGYDTGNLFDPGAAYGGGAYDCTLNNCVLSGNSAVPDSYSRCDYWCTGGGIPYCCHYSVWYTRAWGGGAYQCTLNNCALSGNSASAGGGAFYSTLNNCTLTDNDSGAYSSTLNNCTLTGNGNGASSSTLSNCTLTGNGSGASASTLKNCIAYFNSGANYDASSTLNYCCTTPLPTNGVGNISADPQLASFSHLSARSPCRGAGDAASATGADIDGEAWLNPPSIGCDEYHVGMVPGPLSVGMTASLTTVTLGYAVRFTGLIEGRTTGSVWDFGDGITATNQPYTSHAWTALGDHTVVLRAYNESWPDGISATTTVHVVAGIHYVASNNANPVAPYTSWATAAINIQDAVDAAIEPGAQVLVTNGTYAAGSRASYGTNRVVVDKALRVRSVNGPVFTTIDGGQSVRCVYMAAGSSLSGFTLANGAALDNSGYGGGAFGGALTNCTLNANSARFGGGGAYNCTLINCALTGNATMNDGGGAHSCALKNCTLTGNSASGGGGAYNSTLNNCISYFNISTNGANYDFYCTVNYSCTTPLPTNGVGNIASDPHLASASHLSLLSPCLGQGNYAAASGVDIDGEPWANPPSMGCDELHPGATTGPLRVDLTASFTNFAVDYAVAFASRIEGPTDLTMWTFGDGGVEINQPYVAHSWSTTGDYVVSLWAFNDSYPGGISATTTVHVVAGVHYVALNNAGPEWPYLSWATAATNIQDAVDAALEPGAQVRVTNGTYATGGRTVVIAKPLAVRSVNGAQFTAINGEQANRCVSLTNGATLIGFTLTNGAGGAFGGTLNNCTLTGNSASSGGGAHSSILNNCTLTDNSASRGGGAYSSILNNCTVTGNSATDGGGAYQCTLNNSIAYFNTATNGPNYYYSSLSYCCTTPQPAEGVGNIASEPRLASFSHLSAGSPCRGAGKAGYATGTDIDGEAWLYPPSIGCDEYRAGEATGPLNVGITASYLNVTMGYTVQLTAGIEGRTTASGWDFGDGITDTNQPFTSHAWTALGDYAVVLRAFNESQPGGISATVTVHVVNPVHYVAADSPSPVAPYTSWATAATNIQDAVEAATVPGALVLVTNGTYATGGRTVDGTLNRVVIDKLLTVRSVNGARFTMVNGGYSGRCAYLANGANLSGFTLTNGFGRDGAGVFCESVSVVVSNCVLAGNSAVFGGGGGASGGTLNNCTLTGNWAYEGAGAYECTLNNCTLSGNSASYGGGASTCTLNNCTLTGNSARYSGGGAFYHSKLNNCIAYFNTAPQGANYDGGTLNYCCTVPQPWGLGNISDTPRFVDRTSGNLRLQSDSPCINAGLNAFAPAGPDLDGNPRIAGDAVDIGAHERQDPVSRISYAWLGQYGLPINANTDASDPDGDGLNNWQESRCLTDPTNALSALRLLSPVTAGTNVMVSWESVAGVSYFLERSTNPATSPFTPLAANVVGQPGTTTYIDTNAIGTGGNFYRVGVSFP